MKPTEELQYVFSVSERLDPRLQVSEAEESPVVQLSDGQTVQVQGVIQAPQTSVIQSPQVQTAQVRERNDL